MSFSRLNIVHVLNGRILLEARLSIYELFKKKLLTLKQDEYQILEARLAGADTVLLIIKMLDEVMLDRLYHYSQTLGMEPLVRNVSF